MTEGQDCGLPALFKEINEGSFAVSYTSYFEKIKTSHELCVPSQYENISSAIKEASPGDTIVLDDGVYQESTLNIDKPIEIKSKSNNPNNCFLKFCGFDGIISTAAIVRFVSIGLECNGIEENSCIKAKNGIVEIWSCIISTCCGSAFSIGNQCEFYIYSSKIIPRSKNITKQSANSILFCQNCTFYSQYKENNVEKLASIEINCQSKAHLEKCKLIGVFIVLKPFSHGLIRDCDFSYSYYGINIEEKAEAMITRVVFNHLIRAISLLDDSRAAIQECSFVNQRKAIGVEIIGAKDVGMSKCLFEGAELVGCRIVSCGLCSIYETKFDKVITGIQEEKQCFLDLRNSLFIENHKCALFLNDNHQENSYSTYIINCTFKCLNYTIIFPKNQTVLVSGCYIEGPLLISESTLYITKSIIFGIKQPEVKTNAGIICKKNSRINLEDTKIEKWDIGILIQNNSMMYINKCNLKSPLYAIDSSYFSINDSTFTKEGSIHYDLRVYDNATGQISNSKLEIVEKIYIKDNGKLDVIRSVLNGCSIVSCIEIEGDTSKESDAHLTFQEINFNKLAIKAKNLMKERQIYFKQCSFSISKLFLRNFGKIELKNVKGAIIDGCMFDTIKISLYYGSSLGISNCKFGNDKASIHADASYLAVENSDFSLFKDAPVSLKNLSKAIFKGASYSCDKIAIKSDGSEYSVI